MTILESEDFLLPLCKDKFSINFKLLDQEVRSLNYSKYSNFFKENLHEQSRSSLWFANVEGWRACDVPLNENPEIAKLYQKVQEVLKECAFLEVTSCRALWQKAGTKLIMHEHTRVKGQNQLCINYVCSENGSPIIFEKYGAIDYRFAMLNSVEPHCVLENEEDRYVVGVQMQYTEDWAQWSDVKSALSDFIEKSNQR